MKDVGKVGCAFVVLGLAALTFFSVSAIWLSRTASALQVTQLASEALVQLTILLIIGVGFSLLAIDRVADLIDKRTDWLQQRMIAPRQWEYCQLMEGRVPQGTEYRKVTKLLHYGPNGSTPDQSVEQLSAALNQLSREYWELVSVSTVVYGGGASETSWVFKRQMPPAVEAKKK